MGYMYKGKHIQTYKGHSHFTNTPSYWCNKCKKYHDLNSAIGKRHEKQELKAGVDFKHCYKGRIRHDCKDCSKEQRAKCEVIANKIGIVEFSKRR